MIDDEGLQREVFRDDKLELFVWKQQTFIRGFELHYMIETSQEWSFRWTQTEGTSFHRPDSLVTSGGSDGHTMVPISEPPAELHDLHAEFVTRGQHIDDDIRRLVLARLAELTCTKNRANSVRPL